MHELTKAKRSISFVHLFGVVLLALTITSCDNLSGDPVIENQIDVYFHSPDSFNLIDYGIIDSSDVLILEKINDDWVLVNRVDEDIPYGFKIIQGTAVGAMMRVYLSVNREEIGTFEARNRIVFPGKFITLTSYMTKTKNDLSMDSIKVIAEMHSGELPIRIVVQ